MLFVADLFSYHYGILYLIPSSTYTNPNSQHDVFVKCEFTTRVNIHNKKIHPNGALTNIISNQPYKKQNKNINLNSVIRIKCIHACMRAASAQPGFFILQKKNQRMF